MDVIEWQILPPKRKKCEHLNLKKRERSYAEN